MNHDSYDDAYIAGILNSVKTIAIVGASANDVRPSFFVLKYLLDKGFDVFPVNPEPGRQRNPWPKSLCAARRRPESRSTWSTFSALRTPVPGIVDEVLKLDPLPKVIWMQLTVRHDEAAARAEAAGIKVVMNRCPKIEYGTAVRRDRLDRRQFRRAVVEEAGHAPRLPEFRHPPEIASGIDASGNGIPETGSLYPPRFNLRTCSDIFFFAIGLRFANDSNRFHNTSWRGNNVPAHTGLQHARHPCRRQARSGDRRARHADLPDDVLRLRRRRPRRLAVRAEGLRQHLHPHHEPDPGGARGARRRT